MLNHLLITNFLSIGIDQNKNINELFTLAKCRQNKRDCSNSNIE